MKKLYTAVLAVPLLLGLSRLAFAGERVICVLTMPTDAGAISTADQITASGCSASLLQVDAGLLSDDGGSLLPDGGVAGCVACNWGPVRSLALQCDNPVYYSERPDGGQSQWGQKGVAAATTSDMLIDFDINPDPYRIDLRAGSQHISVKSTTVTANTCRVGTISRNVP